MHELAVERFLTVASGAPTIEDKLSIQSRENKNKKEKERSENREIVEIISDSVLFLAKQGIAFRGHDESDISTNRGNFIEMLYFLAKYNPRLQHWLDKHPGNFSFTSPDIQNEMIKIATDKIRESISLEVRDSGYFALICDEVSDVGNIEWVTIVLCYVKGLDIMESLIAIVPITSLTADSLFETITNTLIDMNIDISNLVAQCYDGAANMSGNKAGLQTKIRELAGEKAVFIHCLAHSLNLVVCNSMKSNLLVERCFGALQKLYAFIERTPKRHHKYVENLDVHCSDNTGKQKLQILSDTRWSSRADNLEVVANCLPAILATLKEFENDDDANG